MAWSKSHWEIEMTFGACATSGSHGDSKGNLNGGGSKENEKWGQWQRVLKTTQGLTICWRTHRIQHRTVLTYVSRCSKDTKQNQQREKVQGVKSGRNQAEASFQGSSPSGVTQNTLNTHNLSKAVPTREAHERLKTQGFHWRLVM